MPYYSDQFYEGADATFTINDWKEVIGDQQPGGGDSFSLESGESSLTLQVPWLKARSFIRFCLGWSFCRSATDPKLYRENPVEHPRFPWLTATTVSFQGSSPVGIAGVGTKVAGIYTGSVPVAKYEHLVATVRFTDKPWTFLDDDVAATLGEQYRNTYFDPTPSIEIISAEGINSLKFFYNPGFILGPGTQGVPAPFGTLMAKITQTMNWMYVPNEYISGSDSLTFLPSKIQACVGRVNSADFLGFPANTLLLQAPKYDRCRFPIATAEGVYGYFGWNIKLPFQYFSPDLGPQTGVPSGGVFRGHQVLPWRSNLLWYPAVRELSGATAATLQKLYPEADFATIFEHV